MSVSDSDLGGAAAMASRVLEFLVFGRAALGKLRRVDGFVAVIGQYDLIAPKYSRIAGWLIITCESFVAVCQLRASTAPFGAAAGIGLLLLFSFAMTINIAAGRTDIDCGCSWAEGRQPIGLSLIVRNVVIVCLALPALTASAFSTTPIGLLCGLAAGSAIFLLILTAERLRHAHVSETALRKRYTW